MIRSYSRLVPPLNYKYAFCSASSNWLETKRTKIRSILNEQIGNDFVVRGWIRSIRKQKNNTFVNINDGSTIEDLQGVVVHSEKFEQIDNWNVGSSIEVFGKLTASAGKKQRVDLNITDARIIGNCDVNVYPLQRKHNASTEQLRAIAHLRPRTNTIASISRIRSQLAYATHKFFQEEGFTYVHTPILTSSDCEGAGEMFRVTTLPMQTIETIPYLKETNEVTKEITKCTNFQKDFFHKPMFLTVSGQLSAEAYACALSDVYTFGPTFRAEKSNTNRHLAEFYMIEPEMAFCNMHEAMDNAESYLKYVITEILLTCQKDLLFLQQYYDKELFERLNKYNMKPTNTNAITDTNTANNTPSTPDKFIRISYAEAIILLQEEIQKDIRKWQYPDVHFGIDLQSEHEKWLATVKFKNSCVFVYNYPRKIKSFYMRDNDVDNGNTVHAFDLLVPKLGELIGGSQREERLEKLEFKINEIGLNMNDYDWYCDLRRYGTVPHSGYGVGFERLLCYITGIDNIRDVIPFPRSLGSAMF